MSKFWSDLIRGLTPYVPGEQPSDNSIIKLNTNENPYGPSPCALGAIRDAASDDLRRYPDPNASDLKAVVARHHDIDPTQVFVGNGSDEVLGHVFHALLKHEQPLLVPDITYSFYPVYCGLYDIAYATVPLGENLEIELDNYLRPNGGIVFANPNAPTGQAVALEAIEKLLRHNTKSVVVVDEAYIAFGGDSAVSLIAKYPNLVIVQTLSKSHALAGLRVGFALGDNELIAGLERVKNSFNSYPLDRLAQAGAIAAIEDQEYFETTRRNIIETRERLTNALMQLGFDVVPSHANFLLTSHPNHNAGALAAALRKRAIVVRHFAIARIANHLRISVGSDKEVDALLSALKDIL